MEGTKTLIEACKEAKVQVCYAYNRLASVGHNVVDCSLLYYVTCSQIVTYENQELKKKLNPAGD